MSDRLRDITDDPASLAVVVESLGGSVIHGDEVFDFTFPVGKTKEIVPKLAELGIGVRKLREFVSTNARSGKTENHVTVRAIRRD